MRKINLSPRLASVAAMAKGARLAADIGTDHGYLPVWLTQNGCELVYAADIRPGPLENARRAAIDYDCGDKIRFALCDGLDFPEAESCDAVTIAGMGGETIISILARAPWTKNGVTLALQPQSKLRELCVWLEEQRYAVTDAALSLEAHRIYIALTARHGAQGGAGPIDLLLRKRDPLLPRWLDAEIKKELAAIAGMEKARRETDIEALTEALRLLKKAKEETTKW